jgi:hypothetical protein
VKYRGDANYKKRNDGTGRTNSDKNQPRKANPIFFFRRRGIRLEILNLEEIKGCTGPTPRP